jgi:hypothetical protein
MHAIHEKNHIKFVVTSPSSEDIARIKASEGETAGAFLCIPTTPNTTIPNSALKIAIRRRVGLNLQVPGICKCEKSVLATTLRRNLHRSTKPLEHHEWSP